MLTDASIHDAAMPYTPLPHQLAETLGKRLCRYRLSKNITQASLARDCGIAVTTLRQMEKGRPTSLDTFLRVLVALGLHEGVLKAVPQDRASPIEMYERQGKQRQRARPKPVVQFKPKWRDV